MGKGITLFTLSGFKVRIDATWLIIAVLLAWTLSQGYFPVAIHGLSKSTYWLMGLAGTLALFVSIVLHEFGHSLVARRHGLQIKGITLFIFGGVAEMEDEPPAAKAELLMAIAGPIVSIGLAIAFYLVYLAGSATGWPVAVNGVIQYLAWINGLLAAFNLIPAFPLDGGRVLRSWLWARRNNLRSATRTASRIGRGFGAALIGLGVLSVLAGNFIGGLWWFLIGMFLRGASRTSYQQMEIREALQGEPIERFMNADPITVPPSATVEEFVQEYVYKYHHQMFPVIDGGGLTGCVGTQQVKNLPRSEWDQHTVREVLSKCAEENTARVGTDAAEVLRLMTRTGNSRLMVVDDGRLAGVVSLKDLLKLLSLKLDLEGDGASADMAARDRV